MSKDAFDPNEKDSTLADLLRLRALYHPHKCAYIFLMDGETEEAKLTYGELDQRARAIGALLQDLAAERVLLLYPPGLDYIAAFFGCMYAGAAAVPSYPFRPNRPDPRLQTIATDAQATVVLSTTQTLRDMEREAAYAPHLQVAHWVATDSLAADLAQGWRDPVANHETLALLQYTSGSTATPKGVMISHGNLLHNLQMLKVAFEQTEQSVFVSWLPLFHDMGLIVMALQTVFVGAQCVLMPPASFLQRPFRWLWAISCYKGTASAAPNFAYDLCVRKVNPEERKVLNLNSWTRAMNGAEPVHHQTLERFAEAFKVCGFSRESLCPGYGLAEATVFVSGGRRSCPFPVYVVQGKSLEQNRVLAAPPDDSNAQLLVGCGRTWLDEKVAIVNPQSLTRCPSDCVGEIWVSGPNVSQGYWLRPEETEQTFRGYLADTGEGPFLRTGDLGFLQDGELFVTGRLKDLIIIRGHNYYPQDIEWSVAQSHPALRPGCGAAFSIEIGGEEKLVIVQEVERTYLQALDTEGIVKSIQGAVSEEYELDIYAVVLLKPGHILKTSSGKVQRRACRAGFLDGSLVVAGEWRQSCMDGEFPFSSEETGHSGLPLPPKHRTAKAIQDWLVAKICQWRKVAPQDVDVQEPLDSYGLSSMAVVSLSGELGNWLGCNISPTLVYDYPTIKTLAQYVAGESDPTKIARAPVGYRIESEGIAIIGIGCRFPGAKGPDEFWELLRGGVDAVTEIPAERWNMSAFHGPNQEILGGMGPWWGGFLEQVDQFDAAFFGISPREAAQMDPQQRLLLEVGWEALENAGKSPNTLGGSQTGVFIGISSSDYSYLQFSAPVRIDAYAGSGIAHSIAANRISYLLDLRGPSLAVDTACSSSLVGVYLACQSLRQGECDLALAGGVNLLLTPHLSIAFSQARMLASDGRCKTFDADADGYVRGEGCGIVVLKRLSEALGDGDRILAVLRGSAINHGGRSNGLTAPVGYAQQAVIREALRDARVTPSQVSYVETHGTGTSLGDPIEVEALKAVLMEGRSSKQLCALGSVKTNIGHLEAAAGIAGLIKVVLSLQHGEIPPHLHLRKINPHIPLDDTPFFIPTKRHPWPAGLERRFAGVSSFGFGGANAHMIVGEATIPVPTTNELERSWHVLTLSAKSEKALRTLAHNYEMFLTACPEASLADVCFTANVGRQHLDCRLAVMVDSVPLLRERLAAFAASGRAQGLHNGRAQSGQWPRVAFLFTGQGAQYIGMGRQLYETAPIFRKTLDRCAEILSPCLERPLLSVLYPESKEESLLHETAYAQPALFALEYALAEMWRSWGIEPAAVMGHSVGEYVAACVAGIFNLEDGLGLVAERGRLMQSLPRDGMMAAVLAEEPQVAAAIAPYRGHVSIAAVNGPRNTVISGAQSAVQAVMEKFLSEGVIVRPLAVSHAFHSPLVEPILDAFEQAASRFHFLAPRVPLASNVTGQMLAMDHVPDASYWKRQARGTVRFASGINALVEQGCELFMELGPEPNLLGMGKRCVPKGMGSWLPSLSKGQNDWQVLLGSLSTLYVQGIAVDWAGFDQDYQRRLMPLPTYPFERKRHWIKGAEPQVLSPETRPVPAKALDSGNSDRAAAAAREMTRERENLVRYYQSLSESNDLYEEYLTFAPFPRVVPGFSWALTFVEPERHPEHVETMLRSHHEMRTILFRGLDFSSFTLVLDIGCGYASDLIVLGKRYPHLRLDGCNISAEQIEIGNRRIHAEGFQDRIALYNLDSSRDNFPGQYDLVIGFQVIHHIRDKQGVLSNVGRHLKNGGYMVLAEIVSNLASPIEHSESSAYFIPKAEWAELLAQNHLRIVECVVANREIGNFLHDPDFAENFARIGREYDSITRAHLQGPHLLGDLLKRDLALYLLFTIQKDEYLLQDTILQMNKERLAALVPYSRVMGGGDNEPLPLFIPAQNETGISVRSVGPGQPDPLAREALLASGPDQRRLLESYICEQLGRVLELDPSQLDPRQPMNTWGLDSLMVLDLKKRFEDDLKVNVPLINFFEGLDVVQFTALVLDQIAAASSAPECHITRRSDSEQKEGGAIRELGREEAKRLLAALDQLPDEEVDSLLLSMTAGSGTQNE